MANVFEVLKSAHCPGCEDRLGLFRVKDEFACAACGEKLQSNKSKLEFFMGLGYLVCLPIVWVIADWTIEVAGLPSNYLLWRGIGTVISLVVLIFLFNALIKVDKASNNEKITVDME